MDLPLILFFVMAYAIAWGVFGLLALIARQSGVESPQALIAMAEAYQFEGTALSMPGWLIYLLTRFADFAFSIAGVVMIAYTAGRAGLGRLWRRLTRFKISWKWYTVGLLPILLYIIAISASEGFSSADYSGSAIATALFSLEAGFFVSLFLRGARGEELGLRGFALPRLQERMSPFRASMVIGVLWGAWHLPVLIGRDIVSVIAFSLLSIGLGMLFTWMFNGSGGSLIPGLLFHALQNWEEGFETVFPGLVGTDWELVSTLSLLVLGLLAGVLVWRSGKGKTPNR